MLFGDISKDTEVGDPANWGPSEGAVIPSGLICMWHGTLAAIPSGWVLCDGQNGTPDLREKFVRGAAAAANPGGTGGAATHQHTYTQVPNHTHPITDPGHVHNQMRHSGTTGGLTGPTTAPDTSSSTPADWGNDTGSSTTGITGTENPSGGVAEGTTAAGSSLPPYYDIAYIMKT